jgi:hypothetical protein
MRRQLVLSNQAMPLSVILDIGRLSAANAPDGGPPAPTQLPPLKKQAEAVAGVALSIRAS